MLPSTFVLAGSLDAAEACSSGPGRSHEKPKQTFQKRDNAESHEEGLAVATKRAPHDVSEAVDGGDVEDCGPVHFEATGSRTR